MTTLLAMLLLAAAPAAVKAADCSSCDCRHWAWSNDCKPCCQTIPIVASATEEQLVTVVGLGAPLAERVIEARKGKRIQKLTDLNLNGADFSALEKKVGDLPAAEAQRILPFIELSGQVTDENGNPIKPDAAPFVVKVKGSVHLTTGLHAYLVVRDGGGAWIEPSGKLAAAAAKPGVQEFEDNCYLGEKEIPPPASGEPYEVFAVLADREYGKYEHPDPATFRARSQEIKLRRTH
jgi:hypothetical protein